MDKIIQLIPIVLLVIWDFLLSVEIDSLIREKAETDGRMAAQKTMIEYCLAKIEEMREKREHEKDTRNDNNSDTQ